MLKTTIKACVIALLSALPVSAQSTSKPWIAPPNPIGEGASAYCTIIAAKPNAKFLLISYKSEAYLMVQSDKLANVPDGQVVKIKLALATFASDNGFTRRTPNEVLVEYPIIKAKTVAALMGSLENRGEKLTVSTGSYQEVYAASGLNAARESYLACTKKL